jgi:hemerythrin-like domain-containing protein
VWTLRMGCLRYCRLVHAHHHGEDTHFFPGLRRVNPALCGVIDRLEADHVQVARYLDEVEAAAARLLTDEAAGADLAHALHRLGEHLLAHLDYEEDQLAPTLRRLTGWPIG